MILRGIVDEVAVQESLKYSMGDAYHIKTVVVKLSESCPATHRET